MSDVTSDLDLGEVAKKRWEKIKAGKKEEKTLDEIEKIEDTLSKRKEAMNVIKDYQDQTGVPTEEETDAMFFADAGVNVDLNELKRME